MSDLCCQRRHRLIRFDLVACRQHGSHRVYRCPMRVGSRVCAERVALPPIGPGCGE